MKNTKWSTEKIVEKFKTIHGNLFDYSFVNYKNAKTKIEIVCNKCKNRIILLPHSHLNGNGCKTCVYKRLPQNQPISLDEFIIKARLIHGNKYEYVGEYKNTKTKIEIKCNTCKNIFKQKAASHLEGIGCKNCFYKNAPQNQPIPISEFEKLCQNLHENKYEYFQDYHGLRHKIKIKCKKCNLTFNQEANAHLKHKQGCPSCNFSRGEEAIKKWLLENNINFEIQKTFPKCRNIYELRFDFYLPKHNACIEYDGKQHFYAIDYFGGEKKLKITKKNDEIKNNFCKTESINLVRIPFSDFDKIETILETILFLTK